MGHVDDAMKKHLAEQAKKAPAATPAGASADGAAEPSAPAQVTTAAQGATDAGPPAPADAARTPARSIDGTGFDPALVAYHDRGSLITEEYRALRTNLLARFPEKRFCVMITSAEMGEGKTVTCINLGMVLAEFQEGRTVIVDCDLRKGQVARLLNAGKAPGIGDLLHGDAALRDVIRKTLYPNLDVIAAGSVHGENVGEMLGRPELAETLSHLRRDYDHVLIDTAPVNTLADAGLIAQAAQDALLVVRLNRTSRDSVKKAVRLLHAVNARLVGMVLTHQEYYIPRYLYRYS